MTKNEALEVLGITEDILEIAKKISGGRLLSPEDTAKVLGTTAHSIRMGLNVGVYPFGVAIPSKGGVKHIYQIYPKRLMAYINADDLKTAQ